MFGLKKLFGGKSEDGQSTGKKKNSGFFRELDESEDNQVTQAVEAVASKVGSATSAAVDTVKSTVSQVTDEVSNSNTEPVAETKQESKKPTQKQPRSVKEKAKTQQKAKPTAPAQILQEKIPTSVKPVSDANGQGKSAEAMTFAPQYLAPTTTQPRRRPGPSMEMFKDMARQVNTPKPKQ